MELDKKNNLAMKKQNVQVEAEREVKTSYLAFDEIKSELQLIDGAKRTAVVCKPCFPWSSPGTFISLIDSDGKTQKIVESLSDLSDRENEALVKAMTLSGFLFEITQIFEIEEEFELRHWHVETNQGMRTFQTAIENWPRPLAAETFLVEDIGGDLYLLRRSIFCQQKARSTFEALLD